MSAGGIRAEGKPTTEQTWTKSPVQSANFPVTNSNILWGAAASALVGATLAEWKRKRDEEELARQREREERLANGPSSYRLAGMAYQRSLDNFRETLLEGGFSAEDVKALKSEVVSSGYIPSAKEMVKERKEEEAAREAARQDYREGERGGDDEKVAAWLAAEEARKAEETQAGLLAYDQGRKAGETPLTPVKETNWLSNLWNAGTNALAGILSTEKEIGGGGKLAIPAKADLWPPEWWKEIVKTVGQALDTVTTTVSSWFTNSPTAMPTVLPTASVYITPGGAWTPTPTSLPTATPFSLPINYIVKDGDTLSNIAQFFGLTGYQAILDANQTNSVDIKIGQSLTIPPVRLDLVGSPAIISSLNYDIPKDYPQLYNGQAPLRAFVDPSGIHQEAWWFKDGPITLEKPLSVILAVESGGNPRVQQAVAARFIWYCGSTGDSCSGDKLVNFLSYFQPWRDHGVIAPEIFQNEVIKNEYLGLARNIVNVNGKVLEWFPEAGNWVNNSDADPNTPDFPSMFDEKAKKIFWDMPFHFANVDHSWDQTLQNTLYREPENSDNLWVLTPHEASMVCSDPFTCENLTKPKP